PALRWHDRPQQAQRVVAVPLRHEAVDVQEELRLIARGDLRQAPDLRDPEPRHADPTGESHDRRVADDVAHARRRHVVRAPDHRRQQPAIPVVQRAVPDGPLAQGGHPKHRLEHAGGRDLPVEPAAPQVLVGPHPERHRPLPARRPLLRGRDVRRPGARHAGKEQRCEQGESRQAPHPVSLWSMSERGPSTRAIHAGLPDPVHVEPFLPGPVFAAPYHLRGPADAAPYGYGRDQNPTWTHLEHAIGELDGGESVVFSSGMAAVTAVIAPRLGPGDRLVAPRGGYPGIRKLSAEQLVPGGIEVRLVPTETDAIVAASEGAKIVWVETPSNPKLD